MRRGPDAAPEVSDWFRTLDRLVAKSAAFEDFLAEKAGGPVNADGSAAIERAAEIAELYGKLTGEAAGADPVKKTASALRGALAGKPPDAALDAAAAALVFPMSEPSLNRWVLLMRQKALEAGGPSAEAEANALLTVTGGPGAGETAFLDIGRGPGVSDGRVAAPSLRALAACAASGGLADARAVAADERLWIRSGETAFYADLSGASGARVRIRRRERGGGAIDQAGFYFLTRALFELGYAVGVSDGRLSATLGGERAPGTPGARIELFAAAWKAFALSRGLGAGLKDYLAGSVSQDENARRLDALARIFAAEGDLPFYDPARPGTLAEGAREYLASNARREALRADLEKKLSKLGLRPFPAGTPVGRRTIGLHFNAPVASALARGDLQRKGTEIVRDPKGSGLGEMADRSRGKSKNGGFPPGLLGSLAPAAVGVGLIGAPPLWEALRASVPDGPDRWIVVGMLRDLGDGSLRFAGASRAAIGTAPVPLDAKAAAAELERMGFSEAPGAAAPGGVRDRDPSAEAHFARVLRAADQEPFTARLTYDRSEAAGGGRIFVVPYLTPADAGAVAKSRALIMTSGGPQAAILAARAGICALELSNGSWEESSGLAVERPVLGKPRRSARGVAYREAVGRGWIVLREGDAIRLDPRTGRIDFLPPDAAD